MTLATPIATVWAILSDLEKWPQVMPGVSQLKLPEGLEVDKVFIWKNSGAPITSRLAVVNKNVELTWTGRSLGVNAVHRIVLKPVANGTHITTEESMSGPLLTIYMNNHKLAKAQQAWCDAITKAAMQRH